MTLDNVLREFFEWSGCLKPADEKYGIAVFEKQNGKIRMVREDFAPMRYTFLADKGPDFKMLGKHYNCAGDGAATMEAMKKRGSRRRWNGLTRIPYQGTSRRRFTSSVLQVSIDGSAFERLLD